MAAKNHFSVMARHKSLGLGLAICSLVSGCLTTEKSAGEKEKTHYILELGEGSRYPAPLPIARPVLVKWYHQEELIGTEVGYRLWDFDRDGHTDMIETLNPDGTVRERAYDFNGDNLPDRHGKN